jgi:ABC transporter substrate binding protein
MLPCSSSWLRSMCAEPSSLVDGTLVKPLASAALVQSLIAKAAAEVPGHRFSEHFLLGEWTDVVDAWQLRSWDAYRDVSRLGRTTRIDGKQRESLWAISERVRAGGSNITGLAILAPELDAKRLELLHGALPSGRRIAALVDVSAPGAEARRGRVSDVASQFGLALSVIEADGPQAYEDAFAAMQAAGAQALAIGASPQFARDGARLAKLAIERNLPTICQWREMAEQGCLLSYGPSRPDLFRRTASFVARLLKGASPGELPIEQPTNLELVVNAKTAKTLGIDIPPTLLARADEVIE